MEGMTMLYIYSKWLFFIVAFYLQSILLLYCKPMYVHDKKIKVKRKLMYLEFLMFEGFGVLQSTE
jgi:hypothetical protein